MRIQADSAAELDEAFKHHSRHGWGIYKSGRDADGTHWAELKQRRAVHEPDHPAVSAAAVELRKLGVSYETAKPILRRVFNAGKGAGA
jgi:hypothetical protein